MVLIRDFVLKIQTFLEMIKIEHSVFALPFAYLGLFLAEGGWPRGRIFFWVTVAMISFRTMAMCVNRFVDLSLDRLNPRTKNRALPAAKLRLPFVWGMTFFSLVVFEWSAYKLNLLCFQLSWIPVLLAWFYPWMKRFTWFSHFILGIILGIAPYGAWLASCEAFSIVPAFLMLGVAAWVAGFDVIYALQDLEFDRTYGLYSFPARFGSRASLVVAHILHGIAVAAWFIVGWLGELGTIYIVGLLVVLLFLVRENWLVHRFGQGKIQEAFFMMNAVVSLSLFIAAWMDISLRGVFS